MSSRRLEDLDPKLRSIATWFLEDCERAGIEVVITCTYRSDAEQADLYALGRTTPGRIVTNAGPGESEHNVVNVYGAPAARAFDIVPIRAGKAIWDANDPAWRTAGEIGEKLGLDWAGRWRKFPEYPHFQLKKDAV